jgi:hypothetical protein
VTELVIGIDPDLKENGVGIVSSGKLVDLQALDFFKLQAFIQEQHAQGAHFAVENVSINKPRFMRAAKDAKKDAKLFNRLTGWTGRSSADKRDAAMLALYVARRKPCVRPN